MRSPWRLTTARNCCVHRAETQLPYPGKWGVNSGIALFRLDRLRDTGWAVAIDNIMTQVSLRPLHTVAGITARHTNLTLTADPYCTSQEQDCASRPEPGHPDERAASWCSGRASCALVISACSTCTWLAI